MAVVNLIYKDSNEYLRFTNSLWIRIKTENLNINTSTFDVQTDYGVHTWFKLAIDGDGYS